MNSLASELINPEEDTRWDTFVEQHPDGWIYHLSKWQRVLQDSFSHIRGQCLVMADKASGRIVAGLPIFTVSSRLTGKKVVSAPFSTLITPLVTDNEHLPVLLANAQGFCRQNRCSRLEIRSLKSYAGLLPGGFSEACNYKLHTIDLTQPVETLYKKLDRSCVRQRIARAKSNNVVLKKGDSSVDMREFYHLYLRTRKRVGRPAQPYKLFLAMVGELHPSGSLDLLFACKDGRPLAGILLLKYKKRVSAEWAASDETHKQMSPNQFLFWEAIQEAKDQGFEVFDFGRTSISNNGLMDFKSRWGTAASDMFEIFYPGRQQRSAERYTTLLAQKTVLKVCRVTPYCLFEPLGNMIYKHLG